MGAALQFPLPILPFNHIRGQFFANSGVLTNLESFDFPKNLASAVPSTAMGLGLAARFAGFKLELNYCLPIYACSTDSIKPGFQFGIGMEFM